MKGVYDPVMAWQVQTEGDAWVKAPQFCRALVLESTSSVAEVITDSFLFGEAFSSNISSAGKLSYSSAL